MKIYNHYIDKRKQIMDSKLWTAENLQTLPVKNMILLLENIVRRGISSVMGDRYVISDENKMILYINAINRYGHLF